MRLGTRRSALALAQAGRVAELIGDCELVAIATAGDAGRRGGDKSRWVSELERALAAGEIDLAVHSAKDVPGELAEGMELMGAPARAGAQDVLCGAPGLDALRPGARVGTSSIRRRAQLRSARADLEVVPLRGNVDTRLAKLADADGALDAIVLARAGLQRLGRLQEEGAPHELERFVPAPGQGVIVLEGRAGDSDARRAAETISDERTMACLAAERAVAGALGASCHTPLGAHALASDAGALLLRAWVGLPDGSAWAADVQEGPADDPARLGALVAERLSAAGARELLVSAEEMSAAEEMSRLGR
jgi:hydroxymethylbilane synthase